MWKRVLKGLTAIFCGQFVITAGNLLLVPLYLVHWSATVYGEWLALFSLVSYLSTLDLGMNMAVVNQLTQAYARGDLKEYAYNQHSALGFYLILAGGGSLLLALAVWLLPIPSWLGLRETPPGEAAWVIWLLGLQVLWTLPSGFIVAVYRTTGNLARSQWIGNIQRLAVLGLTALILFLGGNMQAVALWQLTPLIIVVSYAIWDLGRRFPALLPRLSKANLTIAKGLIKPSLLFALIMLANAITQQGSIIVISSALGGVAVAIFATSRTLANLIRQVVGAFSNALWPDLTAMEARCEQTRLRVIHRLLVIGSTALCIAFGVSLWYVGDEIIIVWTRGKLNPDLTLLRLLVLLLVVQSPWLASSVFTAAANRHKKLAWSYLISAVIGIGIASVLVRWIGTWAIPVGLIVGEALACYHFVIKDTCSMIDEPYGPFARRIWLGLVVVVMVALVAGWIAHTAIPNSHIIHWVGVGAFTSIGSILATWSLWLTSQDRALLLSRIRPLMVAVGNKVWSIHS